MVWITPIFEAILHKMSGHVEITEIIALNTAIHKILIYPDIYTYIQFVDSQQQNEGTFNRVC